MMDRTGYHRLRLADYLDKFMAAYKKIFGDNRNIDSDTQEGQMIGIFAEVASDMDQKGEDIYNAYNPQSNAGVAMSKQVQLMGLTRLDSTYTVATVTCSGVKGTFIEKGSKIKTSDTGEVFLTDNDVTIADIKSVNVGVTAKNQRAIIAMAGTLTVIVSPVSGWQNVTNKTDAIVGRDNETDTELRRRFSKCKAKIGANMVDSLYSQLMNDKDIKDVYIFENLTEQTQKGVPPRSFETFIKCGKNETIGQIIWNNKTGGTISFGQISVKAKDITGRPQTVYFSRPLEVSIWMILNISTTADFPANGKDQILQAIVDYADTNMLIGTDVNYADLFTPILNSVKGVSVVSMFIARHETPTERENIAINESELATFDKGRITINA